MTQCKLSGSSLRPLTLSVPLVAWLIVGGCSNAHTANGDDPGVGERAAADTTRLAIQPVEGVDVSYTGIEEPRRALLRTEAEWRELWTALAAGRIPPPEPPVIDFASRMVIVAAMGRRPTGGYAISIEDVRATEDTLFVTVVETSPGAGCMTNQALTAPVAVVTVERHAGEPVFREREEVQDCE